jgi:hypothetical protein
MKRHGENLARTFDGSAYNKLQRPDNFPTAPARPTRVPPPSTPTSGATPATEVVREKIWENRARDIGEPLGKSLGPSHAKRKEKKYEEKTPELNYNADMMAVSGQLPVNMRDAYEDSEEEEVMRYMNAVRSVLVLISPRFPNAESIADEVRHDAKSIHK